MLISTVAVMLCERFGFARPDALRLWGLVSAASYVGSLPGGQLLDRTRTPSRGSESHLSLCSLAMSRSSLRCEHLCIWRWLCSSRVTRSSPSTQRIIATLYPTGDRRFEGAQILLYFTANVGAAGGSSSQDFSRAFGMGCHLCLCRAAHERGRGSPVDDGQTAHRVATSDGNI